MQHLAFDLSSNKVVRCTAAHRARTSVIGFHFLLCRAFTRPLATDPLGGLYGRPWYAPPLPADSTIACAWKLIRLCGPQLYEYVGAPPLCLRTKSVRRGPPQQSWTRTLFCGSIGLVSWTRTCLDPTSGGLVNACVQLVSRAINKKGAAPNVLG